MAMIKMLLKAPLVGFRSIMKAVDKDYVKRKTAKRTGECRKCGDCCSDCDYLDQKTRLCKVYDNRPRVFCYKDFPLSKFDQDIWEVRNCGYKFK
jgi:hypothetical protein